MLDRGDVLLFADGRLEVSVRHLVLAAGASAGKNRSRPVRDRRLCGHRSVLPDTSPYSPDGNAMVETRSSPPSPCLAAVVFFAGQTGGGSRWTAVTGG